jgi:integrase
VASVQKHKNRWRTKWYDEQGKARYESFPTEREARDAAKKIEARAVLDGKAPAASDPGTLTVGRWWQTWSAGKQWSAGSRTKNEMNYRLYVAPVFARVALTAVTSADVRRWHRTLERKGLAPRSIVNAHATFAALLQGAVEDELVPRNAARGARLSRPARREPCALTTDQLEALFDAFAAAAPEAEAFARFVGGTGLRRAEATGLTWDRVNLDDGTVLVDRQMNYHAARLPAWAPLKTKKPRRVVLAPATVALLRSHRAGQTVARLDGLVFVDQHGGPWRSFPIGDTWTKARDYLEDTGRPLPAGANGFHTLRHSYASGLLERGLPPATVARQLGHTVPELLATYSHITDPHIADQQLRAAFDS